MARAHHKHLLTSVQMAHFVAHGSLRMDAVVPGELNAEAVEVLQRGIPAAPYGTPLAEAFAEGSFAHRLVGLPAGGVRGDDLRRRTCTVTRSSTSARTRSTCSSCTTRRT